MTDNSYNNFDKWLRTGAGRAAMSGYESELPGCPECAICGDRTNDETEIRGSWEACCICEKWICSRHQAKYCGSACRKEGRKLNSKV